MINYKLIETPTKGVSIYKIEDKLKIRVMINYTEYNNIADKVVCSEIEINNNRILFEPLNMLEDDELPLQGNLLRDFIEKYKIENALMPKLKKFEFYKENKFIRHNLDPRFILEIIQNDNSEYSIGNDVYDLFEFRGNKFAFVIVLSEIDLDEIDDFTHIRSVIKRAWKWYKSQVYIKKHIPKTKESVMENERFILQESKDLDWWICTDKVNKIVIKFKNKMFNESQKVTPLEDFDFEKIGVTGIARILREMGDWLNENHQNKI